MLRPTCCIGRARESIRYYVLGGWVGSFWPWWPFWRSSLDVAFVAIGFTNFEQPGESGFLLANAVFGTDCSVDRCVLLQLSWRRVLQLVILRCDIFAAVCISHGVFSK